MLRLIDPTEGQILFEGEDITKLGTQAMKPHRRNMQIVFQDPFSALDGRMRVGQLIEEPLLVNKTYKTKAERMAKVKEMISDEHRRLGYMAVYPIVNGSAQEALFEGTREQCKVYTDILLENKPEMRGNIIVLEL
jgi:ABC-type microcin C transport system duplicated ATPase subunit YejF